MAEETVNVDPVEMASIEVEQDSLKMTIFTFLMFMGDYGFGLARYPSQPNEEVMFLSNPDQAVDDFVNNFENYVNSIAERQSSLQPQYSSDEDLVAQIMKALSDASEEISVSPQIEEAVEVSEQK